MSNVIVLFFVICALWTDNSIYAASSSTQTSSENLRGLEDFHFILKLVTDGYNDEDTTKYPHIFAILHGNAQPTKELAIPYEVKSLSMRRADKLNPRQEHLSPLLYTLYGSYYYMAITIAKAFPAFITTTDSRGNTAMHYLCASLDHARCTCTLPSEIVDLFDHQINIPNKKGITPIFTLTNPCLLAILYARGAQLDTDTIAHIRPQYWRHSNILGALHVIGIDSTFLATTFKYNTSAIVRASKRLAPLIKKVLQHEVNRKKINLSQGTSIANALTIREQTGRHAQRELHAHQQFAERNNKHSHAKHDRIDDQSADGIKRIRTL